MGDYSNNSIWRLQLKSCDNNSIDISTYCLKNNVASMGWSLLNFAEERKSITAFDKYYEIAKDTYDSIDNVIRLHDDVKENDLIWIRSEGKYYLGRVTKESRWNFNASVEASNLDASNQISNIHWYQAGEYADEESVPGAINTAFFRGQTLQRINKTGIREYSQLLQNEVSDKKVDPFEYTGCELYLSERCFYNLLKPEDVEDLLCLWLYDQKEYVCIPSTNKLATPLYECVLIDPNNKSGKHVYIQVKKGIESLDAEKYAKLNGDVYLLTTEGNVYNSEKYDNIYRVDPTEIFKFACDPDKEHIIPEGIRRWIKFLSEAENTTRDLTLRKGIMFDTNKTYSDVNEDEMFSESVISAYGDAARYIKSFNKADYVLYYSKGR